MGLCKDAANLRTAAGAAWTRAGAVVIQTHTTNRRVAVLTKGMSPLTGPADEVRNDQAFD